MDIEKIPNAEGEQTYERAFTWERLDECSHESFGPVVAVKTGGVKAALCENCNLLVWYVGQRPTPREVALRLESLQ